MVFNLKHNKLLIELFAQPSEKDKKLIENMHLPSNNNNNNEIHKEPASEKFAPKLVFFSFELIFKHFFM